MIKILIVEDEEKIARFIELELVHEGYKVIKVNNGREGLEIAEKGEVDLVLIQDNGIGMDAEDVPHIFERFFRADTARVRKNGGTGLGLSIAKWIIDNHNGYFSVLSRKGIGTRITVYLPEKQI